MFLSEHAKQRMAQRNISAKELEFVFQYGRKLYRGGVEIYFLAMRDLPEKFIKYEQRLVGTTVISHNDVIITIYRDQHALRRVKRLPKRRCANR